MMSENKVPGPRGLRSRSRHAATKAFWSLCFHILCLSALLTCLGLLCMLVGAVLYQGASRVSWSFLINTDSILNPQKAGIRVELVGSLLLMLLTSLFSIPIGIGTAIYLEEYATDSWWKRIVQINIANLAGVPSIVYGILGLGLFVTLMSLGESLIAGALTLSLVILPIVVLASQEALRGVPDTIRHASYALGATRWQTVWRQVLPSAAPGILTGIILALSRAIGETAPLIAVGAASQLFFLPKGLLSSYAVLPLKIFVWADDPNEELRQAAAAAIIVLLTVLIVLNGIAVFLRYRFSKNLVN